MLYSQHGKPKVKRAPALRALLLALFSAIVLFPIPPSYSANWHEGKNEFCGNCHSTHPGREDFGTLSRNDTALCLRCHESSRAKAPNVFKGGKAAGLFDGYGRVSGRGHDLGVAAMTLSMKGPITLECTTCHDPHGNDNYRNLWPDPFNPNRTGVEVTVIEKTGREKYGEVGYVEGISAWCQTCHTELYVRRKDNRAHHSVGVRLTALTRKIKLKRPLVVNLPMNDPLSNTRMDDPATTQDDTINCITCHYAHGSKNPYSLRYADGKTLKSTCRSCHLSGVKTYKPPPAADKPRKPSTGTKYPKPSTKP